MSERQTYFGDWGSFADMVADFEGVYSPDEKETAEMLAKERWQNMRVLFAAYTNECYEGDAFILFKRGDKLYEVNGGHCSCYGLSESSYVGDTPDQWDPEETTKEAVLHRLNEGSGYGIFGRFGAEIRAALESA